ncbi:MFS transporter [Limosilactobacillus mucosae]|uniref:Putative proline/betaine transporter n=1 Tax=Limosilactobacillus mucosae TaxID=97478 RepID=A0AAJ1M9N8_LIMMU|nr:MULTISPECIES: MFS transporter [Lactobacillaceae]MDC2830607.1 MFS transporter [Limosilactobacillus mucosae]MDC2836352.1 MFS transporter [Limosilactobacillus mucosae]MDC2848456.1 MFS transporter [Limosilactobacillus mucosae]MDC2852583.1 MFS transporter [Limosilactobacillus mucosae]NME34785.1 MHS family MFS transporter [Lactobacillus sp. MRS-253-APC-2B]
MENATERMTMNDEKMERDPVKTVILASMMGTAIEFFDFYAYGTASAAYFPKVFFPQMTPLLATLLSLLTFGVAFVARPVGSFVFGHFGDRLGRKKTLVVSLLVMGVATVAIGFIPGYQSIGVSGALLLCLCRFVQGIGLGGEWSGAVLVATENAPADKRALYGAFPEVGAPIGFFICNGLFYFLEKMLTPAQMMSFGWRVPFWASSVLVVIGLYVRHRLQETPLFKLAQERDNTTRSPLKEVFKENWREILKGTFLMGATYAMFFTLTTWSLSFATTALGFSHSEFLLLLMAAIVEFAVLIMTTSVLADKVGRKKVLMTASVALVVFSLVFPYFLEGQHNMVGMLLFLGLGFVVMGTLYGPVGAVLPELFPTKVRYSGAGITYNLAAVVGAAVAPTITTWLIATFGLHYAGMYMFVLAVVSVVAWALTPETKNVDYTK